MYVFISHSSTDAEITRKICNDLESHGIQCFLSSRDIKGGSVYAEEIVDGIDRSDVFLLLLSKKADDSPHVLREVERACSRKIPLLVYKMEQFEISKAMEYFIMAHQWLEKKAEIDTSVIIETINELGQKKNSLAVSGDTSQPSTESTDPQAPVNTKKTMTKDRKKTIAMIVMAAVMVTLLVSCILLFIRLNDSPDEPSELQTASDRAGDSRGTEAGMQNDNSADINNEKEESEVNTDTGSKADDVKMASADGDSTTDSRVETEQNTASSGLTASDSTDNSKADTAADNPAVPDQISPEADSKDSSSGTSAASGTASKDSVSDTAAAQDNDTRNTVSDKTGSSGSEVKVPASGNTGSGSEVKVPASGNTGSGSEAKDPASGNTGSGSEAKDPVSGNTGSGSEAKNPASGNTGSGSEAKNPASGNTGSGSEAKDPASGNTGKGSEAKDPASGNTGSGSEAKNPASDKSGSTDAGSKDSDKTGKENEAAGDGQKTDETDNSDNTTQKPEETVIVSCLPKDAELGDTITLGSYYGEPVEWRILHFNSDGTAILVAKNILTIKPFDVAESGCFNCYGEDLTDLTREQKENFAGLDYEIQRQAKGNNSWYDSNIRTWLNSAKENVHYADTEPSNKATTDYMNGYDQESGFLNGFSKEDLSFLVPYSFTSKDVATKEKHTCNDLVFLLSEKELAWFDEADIKLHTTATAECLEHDKSKIYSTESTPFWWLRDPFTSDAYQVLSVNDNSTGETVTAWMACCSTYFGIRPAICVK